MIDILRATSTIITALHNGAVGVIPCGTTDEAFQYRESLAGTVLLGGERQGVRIHGFDFGNSPAEYDARSVEGRTVVMTTTNGTQAILKSLAADTLLIGAFLNRRAVVERLQAERLPVHLVCAGTDGVITAEDVLFAGAVVDGLMASLPVVANENPVWDMNDSADLARAYWRQCINSESDEFQRSSEAILAASNPLSLCSRIEAVLRSTRGGKNLLDLHYNNDIALCSQLDVTHVIPEFDRSLKCLVPA